MVPISALFKITCLKLLASPKNKCLVYTKTKQVKEEKTVANPKRHRNPQLS